MKERVRRTSFCVAALALLAIISPTNIAGDLVNDAAGLATTEDVEGGTIEHCDAHLGTFEEAFECGDELFGGRFNAVDGVGANVGDGGRFTRVPRADLIDWTSHFPPRATGPNSASCEGCHNQPTGDGAGEVSTNNVRDPGHTADPAQFIQRQVPHVFGSGALQRLAEEMNEELEGIVESTIADACDAGRSKSRRLETKGVDYGRVRVKILDGDDDSSDDDSSDDGDCNYRVRIHADGIDRDLIVRPLQWKGSVESVRFFNREASHFELGMQPVEATGDDVDGDGDGVMNEFSIADMTAMAVYVGGQPRPVTSIELSDLRDALEAAHGQAGTDEADALELPSLSPDEKTEIAEGEAIFADIGCADCHRPALILDDPIFSEPSLNANYRDNGTFPAGQPVIPPASITMDLTTDHPDNIFDVGGTEPLRLADFETNAAGGAIVRLYGDLKRHDMGPGLAENIDEVGTGAANFMTKELWGAGSTDQYLHDGRATTLTEAILLHGGEGSDSRDNFDSLGTTDQQKVVAFLNSLLLFKP